MTDSYLVPKELMTKILDIKPGMVVKQPDDSPDKLIFRCCANDLHLSLLFVTEAPEELVYASIVEGFSRFGDELMCGELKIPRIDEVINTLRKSIQGCDVRKKDMSVHIKCGILERQYEQTELEMSRIPVTMVEWHFEVMYRDLTFIQKQVHDTLVYFNKKKQ